MATIACGRLEVCAGCAYGLVANGAVSCKVCKKLIICAGADVYVRIWFGFQNRLLNTFAFAFAFSTCFVDCCGRNSIFTPCPLPFSPPVGPFIPCTPMPNRTRFLSIVAENEAGLDVGELVGVVGEPTPGAPGSITVLTVANGRVAINEKVRLLLSERAIVYIYV